MNMISLRTCFEKAALDLISGRAFTFNSIENFYLLFSFAMPRSMLLFLAASSVTSDSAPYAKALFAHEHSKWP